MTNIALASTTLSPTTTGFIITGEASMNNLGYSVSQAGDVNNDGFDDVIIGAFGNNNVRGAAYVIYGGPRLSMKNIALGTTPLDTLTTGFSMKGHANGDRFGSEVSTVGDVNSDGYGDIIVGSRGKNNYQGAAYLIYGGPKPSMANLDMSAQPLDPLTTGFTMIGAAMNNYFGFAASVAGDVNSDGFGDIIIGAYGWNNTQGAVYVIYGGPKSLLPNIDFGSTVLDPKTTGFMIKGKGHGSMFGYTVNGAGNMNGDESDDIVIGAYGTGSNNQGAAYLIHSTCPIEHCEQCISRSCKVCEQGYGVANSTCEACLMNCSQCSISSKCDKCKSPYLLYQCQCLQTCPNRTFSSSSGDKCQDCPLHCSSCVSEEACQTCDQGYVLTNSLCTYSLSEALKIEAKVSHTLSSAASSLGSVLCIGSSTFPVNTLMSKTVQNTRYIDLSVTDKLAEAYKSWGTQMVEWDLPDVFSRLDNNFGPLPFLFAKYELGPPFLVNFWSTMMTMAVSLTVLILASALKNLTKGGWAHSFFQKIVVGSLNFTVAQAYGCLDDILFYSILDLKTNPFKAFFAWASFFTALGFIVLGVLMMLLNIIMVKRYQKVKKQCNSPGDLETWNIKNKYWEIFYSDFNDNDAWSHCFLALLIMRNSVSSLIIAGLSSFRVTQTTCLMIMDGAIILFLIAKKPFITLRATIAQYFYEIAALLVHISVFILSLQNDAARVETAIICTFIIYLNMILVAGGTAFMLFEVLVTVKELKTAWKAKRKRKKTVIPISINPSENSVNLKDLIKKKKKSACGPQNEVPLPSSSEMNESHNMSSAIVGLNTGDIETIYLVDPPRERSLNTFQIKK